MPRVQQEPAGGLLLPSECAACPRDPVPETMSQGFKETEWHFGSGAGKASVCRGMFALNSGFHSYCFTITIGSPFSAGTAPKDHAARVSGLRSSALQSPGAQAAHTPACRYSLTFATSVIY